MSEVIYILVGSLNLGKFVSLIRCYDTNVGLISIYSYGIYNLLKLRRVISFEKSKGSENGVIAN